MCGHAGHDLSQAMARSARKSPPTRESQEVLRQQMRHCKFGTQAREHGDLQDPFAFVCPASIDLVLALFCQLEDAACKAEEHLPPLDRSTKGRHDFFYQVKLV